MELPPLQHAASEYARKIDELEQLQAVDRRRERTCGYAKLAIAVVAFASAAFVIRHIGGIIFLSVLATSFLVLAVWQSKLLDAIRCRTRSIRFYQRGQERLQGTWRESGETGERFLRPEHPYARDLDIFGSASLFQYLSMARTRAGEEMLADWLMKPASPSVIAAREEAVRDLRDRLIFREKLFAAGEIVRGGVHPRELVKWGESAPILSSVATRILTTVLALTWIAGVVLWAWTGIPYLVMLMTLLNFGYAHQLISRLEKAAGAIEHAADDLSVAAEVLMVIERESFTSPRLLELRASLKQRGVLPSRAIRRLARLSEYIQSRHSLFLRPLDILMFWSAQLVFRAETWQKQFGPAIRIWLAVAGELEALASLAGIAYEHPEYAFAELTEDGPTFDAECLAHPLLPQNAVENDVCFDAENALIVLSGPNMAGKSTFIRSIGVNAVLAQCGGPIRAQRLRMSPLQVAASICILDSLSGGVSRFYAEIQRLKLINDLAAGSMPVLFLLDELLSGTNSHDRLAGTEHVLRSLLQHRAVGIVSTHDLALTRIPDRISDAKNAHFTDRIEGGKLVFDYKLMPGVVDTSSALELMRAIGLGVPPDSDLPPVE